MKVDRPSCSVWITPTGQRLRREDPAWYCGVVVHEVGHLRGLSHQPSGLMKRLIERVDVPWDCRVAARGLTSRSIPDPFARHRPRPSV